MIASIGFCVHAHAHHELARVQAVRDDARVSPESGRQACGQRALEAASCIARIARSRSTSDAGTFGVLRHDARRWWPASARRRCRAWPSAVRDRLVVQLGPVVDRAHARPDRGLDAGRAVRVRRHRTAPTAGPHRPRAWISGVRVLLRAGRMLLRGPRRSPAASTKSARVLEVRARWPSRSRPARPPGCATVGTST